MRLWMFCVSLQLIKDSMTLDVNDDLIIGGRTAYIEEFPFIVSVQSNDKHSCGGSLLSTTHVLTACHCVVDKRSASTTNLKMRPASSYTLIAGTVNQNWKETGAVRNVRALFIHPECTKRPTGWQFDFAMIVASEKFILKPGVLEIIPVPNFTNISLKQMIDNHADCVSAGWGKTDEASKLFSPILMQVDLQLMPASSCYSRVTAFAREVESDLRFWEPAQLCTIGEDGKDACQGDSGGPLVCEYINEDKPILCAIVSWGFGCGREGIPGVWARLDVAEIWIRKILAHGGTGCNHPTSMTFIAALISSIKIIYFALLSSFYGQFFKNTLLMENLKL